MIEQATRQRIVGYDLARSIAIFGMVVHHCVMAMAADEHHPRWLALLMAPFDGRPAALFMILAGVGITLRSRKVSNDAATEVELQERHILRRRGLVLLALGFLNLLIWPGDILRIYGVSLLIAAEMIRASNRQMLLLALSFVIGFFVLLSLMNYEQNWDWRTLTYHNLWTLSGSLRNLFYDGFRSIFPWTGFLFFGMWLGRQDLADPGTNRRWLIVGLSVMISAEVISLICVSLLSGGDSQRQEEIHALFGTGSMPPLPLFLSGAGGLAILVITVSIRLTNVWPKSRIIASLVATGQMALTWYFAHIYLGLGTIVVLELVGNQSLEVAVMTGVAFFVFAALASSLWKRSYRFGPLEWAMRQLAG